MARNVVGLDIGTTAVRAAELSIRNGQVVLVRLGQVGLPHGAVVDGEVVDPTAVATAIRALRQQTAIDHLPGPDRLPIPVEGVEVDFDVLAELEGQGGQRVVRILLVAAQKEMIAGHLTAVSQAGLHPVSIDLNSFALLHSLVDIGARVTNVVVHLGGAHASCGSC